MERIELHYGAAAPLLVETTSEALVGDLAGPAGAEGVDAERLVAEALATPLDGPPLSAHVVPGDRVVVAVSGGGPQMRGAVAAVIGNLAAAGVGRDSVVIIHAGPAAAALDGAAEFHASAEAETSYLAADKAGHPVHVARLLVDADVVVSIGAWSYDARLGGRSLDGELWPAFGREECETALAQDLARRGRRSLRRWAANLRAVTWHLGVRSCLRLVAGRRGTLAAATFGTAAAAARLARQAAHRWAPSVSRPADLAICSLSQPAVTFGTITRAVAAAARIVRPGGTICVATASTEPPGAVVSRWRQGAPLQQLVTEARRSGDLALVTDAVVARFFARGLDDRRLVLLSNLEESLVEDLEFGFAAGPDTVGRLARRSENLVVLHEADLMFPHLTPS